MANPDRMGFLKRTSIFLGYQEGIRGLISSAAASASTGAGDAPEAEASTLSAVGLHMDPTTDGHNWYWTIPRDLNYLHEINMRVRYSTASATSADDRQWVILYDVIAEDAALAIGTTALSTAIVAETDNGTANAWQDSPVGTLNGQVITEANVINQDLLAINLVLLLDDASEEMNMYGLIIDYVPKRYQGHPGAYNPTASAE